MEPTYTLWTPRILRSADRKSEVRFNVTPYSVDRTPVGSNDFYGQLLSDLGVGAQPVSWTVIPYRTSYHGSDQSTSDPQIDWKRNWLISVKTSEATEGRAFRDVYETEAYPAVAAEQESDHTACFVLVDFGTEHDLAVTQTTVANEFQDELEKGLDRFEVVNMTGATPPFWQLQIEIGRFPKEFFNLDAPLARRIEAAFRARGGWPTFEERVVGLERRSQTK